MRNLLHRKENIKTLMLLLVPLVLGLMINSPIFGYRFPLMFSLIFLGFWFWVGMKFTKLNIGKVYSLLIGNSLNIISFVLFIWSFFIISDANRNLFIAGSSQIYAMPTLSISAMIYRLTNPAVLTNEYVIISYILMSLIFTLGYLFEARNNLI
ncbi:MAG: hypothetical protein FH756_04190 [Firmicutes bacterium]|nr:hypothetical protein [Bacillota bacterium]